MVETRGFKATTKFYIDSTIIKITVNNPRCVPASPNIKAMSEKDSTYVQGKHAENGLARRTSYAAYENALIQTAQDSKRTCDVTFRRVRMFPFWIITDIIDQGQVFWCSYLCIYEHHIMLLLLLKCYINFRGFLYVLRRFRLTSKTVNLCSP